MFGKDKPIHQKSLTRLINDDLKHTSKVCNIPSNIKSHSFRINMILNLSKEITVEHTAQILGHNDIKSTMSRYALRRDSTRLLQTDIET